MPPLAWARPATPEAEEEAEGLAEADGGEDWTAGPAGEVVPACGVFGTRPVKLEPRIRLTVPGVRLATRSVVTSVSSCLSVFTAAMSAAEEYSMTEVV